MFGVVAVAVVVCGAGGVDGVGGDGCCCRNSPACQSITMARNDRHPKRSSSSLLLVPFKDEIMVMK